MQYLKNIFSGSKQTESQSTSPTRVFSAQAQKMDESAPYTSPSMAVTPQNKKREELLLDIPLIKKQSVSKKEVDSSPVIDLSKMVSLKLETRYQKIKSSAEPQSLPLMVTLAPSDKDLGQQRVGLDIVIVIDVSGSMDGEKIQLVVETLLFIIDEMQESDRLSIIAFDDKSEILTNLAPMTASAKEEFKKVVLQKIKSRGSTNINKGLVDAFDVMLNRKQVNDVTAVLLLSDGQDTSGNNLPDFEKTLKEYDAKMSLKGMSYKINSFGYGEGHDEKVLGLISNFKEGNFYYIKSLQLVDECFIDCLGYLMSVFGSQAEIALYMSGKTVLLKKYGMSWVVENNPSKSTVKIGNVAAGMEKNYIAEIQVPSTQGLKEVKVCSALLNFVAEGQNYMVQTELILPVVIDEELGAPNEKLEKHLVRVQAAETLKSAENDYKKGNRFEAQAKIRALKNRVEMECRIDAMEFGKLNSLLADDIFEDNKNMVENYEILEKQAYRPQKGGYASSNQVQKQMVLRKKL